MTDRETNLRSVLFLVIGILLLLSLLLCVFLVSNEKDLKPVDAAVSNVVKDANGEGKHSVTVTYDVDGVEYHYNFTTKKDYNIEDKVSIYYHSEVPTSIVEKKTSKLIFLCPVVGLVLCIIGLFELYKKPKKDGEEFKTAVIGVVGNTQQLKIVDDEPAKEYEKTVEEKAEPSVKNIKKEVVEEVEPVVVSVPEPVKEEPVVRVEKKEEPVKEEPVVKVEEVKKPELPEKKEEPVVENKAPSMEEAILKKVQADDNKKVSMDEDDLKQVIKDMLKEVIQEVKVEKEPPKKVEQKRVLPNYYYISGTSLIYEEPGKEAKEINLKDVKRVVRTVNSAGNVVKLIVSNEEVKCILTNMKNIDLEQVANLLHNKMRTIDETFKEEIEYKEY